MADVSDVGAQLLQESERERTDAEDARGPPLGSDTEAESATDGWEAEGDSAWGDGWEEAEEEKEGEKESVNKAEESGRESTAAGMDSASVSPLSLSHSPSEGTTEIVSGRETEERTNGDIEEITERVTTAEHSNGGDRELESSLSSSLSAPSLSPSVGGEPLALSEEVTQYLAVHQELLAGRQEDTAEAALLQRLLGPQGGRVAAGQALLDQHPLLALLHGKLVADEESGERFWGNVAAAAASGVASHNSSPALRRRVIGESGGSEEREKNGERGHGDRARESERRETAVATSERQEMAGGEGEREGESGGKGSEEWADGRATATEARERKRTDDGDRRAAAAALSVHSPAAVGRTGESFEIELEGDTEEEIVMEAGEKQSPARYFVSAVMAVVKIVIVLALLREYEAPLLFYLYPLLWVFILVLLVIRAVQIVVANRAVDRMNGRLATELLPLGA
eukprot:CAMPEP_0114633566 /NCGR_PEP_ID=MMETSP0168-20121206/15520_1 /TAXON_ID=95228 ORGANISM="Vannella sp., Strain DIVA3 517/6/12" /NCGR_SAMPLE_ID=MMETSP0168 /ASSEMBLY_ACC=CAM_ASM_000044 /LENGTH=455 /DNA_ID=CAMNT_0001845219 /DNA_START=72 /DNA_END=1435 /DNA_ORIENTATION=-